MKQKIDNTLNALYPLNRSLAGKENLETLKYIKKCIPIKIKKIPSGKKVFDWTVPNQWELKNGQIIDLDTNKIIIDTKYSKLHVASYSKPINKKISLQNLKKHLFYDKIEDAIPYRTIYYSNDWAFCVTKRQLQKIEKLKGPFKVLIDSNFKKKFMNYGELLIKGTSKKEFLISTYICHPSLANDNLSGLVATIYIAKKILSKKNTKYSYRIIFVPETIGAIAYIHKNYNAIKKIDTGIIVTNVGGPGKYSYKQSFDKKHFLNDLIEKIFKLNSIKYKKYPFDINGSDERQFSSIALRINCCSIFKDKYYEYKFYHTSKDDLNFINSNNILKSINLYYKLILEIEKIRFLKNTKPNCEIMLSKYKLYPKIGGSFNPKNKSKLELETMKWILFLADGKQTNEQIISKLKISKALFFSVTKKLINKKLLSYE